VGRFFGPLQKRDTFQRSKRTVELTSVCRRSTGIRSEQSSGASSAWWPYRDGTAPVCAKSTRKLFRVL
jgi:hypothetical protein